MSLEDFQVIDNEAIDSSIMKSDFLKTYNQQAANLIDFDQTNEVIIEKIKSIIEAIMPIFKKK